MFYKKILLKEIDPKFDNEEATLRIYISERNESIGKRPGLLVCPGGGYTFCSAREAEPIAFRFLSEGFNCFVLDYTVYKAYPRPQLDLALAFAYIRQHEEEFDLLPNCLSIIGFSAGGHLVGSFGYTYPELAKMLGVKEQLLRPFTITMAYPVVTTMKYTHGDTSKYISGGDEKLREKMDIAPHVTKDYPPTFVWTTKDDGLVPYDNSEMMVKALKKNGVKHQYILFESGWHGASLANRCVVTRKSDLTAPMKDIRDWASLVADFIYDIIEK